MINRWEPGRADINAQLTAGYLQKVKPDRRLAELYIEHAKLHLAASRQTHQRVPHPDQRPKPATPLCRLRCRKLLSQPESAAADLVAKTAFIRRNGGTFIIYQMSV